MKQIYSLFVLQLLSSVAFSQSITPASNTEFCPDVETTFTVSVPGTDVSVIGVSGSHVTVPPYNVGYATGVTTFQFKGKFGDVNQAQTFKVYYTEAGLNKYYDFTYKRIKSLFYSTSCAQIQPNQTSIVVPPCQISSHLISFTNIQWGTNFESPTLCFGSITGYEYQLPAGWSIGSTISTGSNWILGGNSVTVTSDMSTGDGMSIKVRPANDCNASLSKNQTPAQIFISRPKPSLSFTAPTTICNTSTFTVNNPPAWVTSYIWQMTPSNLVSISQGNPGTFTKLADELGEVSLTIGSSSCGLSFTYQNFEITGAHQTIVGTPTPGSIVGFQPALNVSPGQILDFSAPHSYQPGFTYDWIINGGSIAGPTNSSHITVVVDNPCNEFISNGYFHASLRYTNACGTSNWYGGNCLIVCGTGGGPLNKTTLQVSPNPTSSFLTVDAGKKSKGIREIQIVDKFGIVRKVVRSAGTQTLVKIKVSALPAGLYFVKVFDGKTWETKQFIRN